jgi:hypothetical protein
MPRFFSRILDRVSAEDTTPVNTFTGITADGRVLLRDRRGTRKAEIPNVETKSETLSTDPLAIYKRPKPPSPGI